MKYDLITFLAVALNVVERTGRYMSKSQAFKTGATSTAELTLQDLEAGVAPFRDKADQARDDLAVVKADLESLKELNDYQFELRCLLADDTVTEGTAGYAASIIGYAKRARKDAKFKDLAKNSNHIGNIKDRLTVKATVEQIRWFTGSYGETQILKFRDTDGNALTWFSSREQNVKVGDTVNLTGTVKKHDEYRGEAQTVLTRCRLC